MKMNSELRKSRLGTYIQFPIKLAWAITVHKSQGLTFKNVNIDFTGGVFAGGQDIRCHFHGVQVWRALH